MGDPGEIGRGKRGEGERGGHGAEPTQAGWGGEVSQLGQGGKGLVLLVIALTMLKNGRARGGVCRGCGR